jgi:hypothetical protein
LLAAAFRQERSEYRRHGIGKSILQIDELFAPVEAPPVLRYLYEHIRCFECRGDLLWRLRAHGALPAAIATECCFDAESGIREYIAERVPGACPGSGG